MTLKHMTCTIGPHPRSRTLSASSTRHYGHIYTRSGSGAQWVYQKRRARLTGTLQSNSVLVTTPPPTRLKVFTRHRSGRRCEGKSGNSETHSFVVESGSVRSK